MFALRHLPSKKYLRIQPGMATNLVADGDLANGTVLGFPDLWATTQFIEKHLKGQSQSIEIVELELREVRVVPPMIDGRAHKNETTGDQFSEFGRV